MSTVQPPNTQTLRPQHLTQVGHEGNPVLCDLPVVGTLDSPSPTPGCTSNCDQGGPVLVPIPGNGGGGGGGGQGPNLPLNVSGGEGNCFSGDGSVPLVATGGTGPYTWSTTVGSITVGSPTSHATLNPPTNPAPDEQPSITAYGKCASACCVFVGCAWDGYNCAGEQTFDCDQTACGDCCTEGGISSTCSSCTGCVTSCCLGDAPGCSPADPLCTLPCCSGARVGDICSCLSSHGTFCDLRSRNGLSGDCQPCAISMQDGAVVTVTDATGQSASTSVSYSTDD